MLIGTINNLTIKDSYILGTGRYVGSITGYARKSSNINNCVNLAEIVYDNIEYEYSKLGGIVGENYGGIISNCYNQGTVRGNAAVLGGIVGGNQGTINKCENLGIIKSERTSSSYVGSGAGGICGCNYRLIINSINNSNIEMDYDIGGIVGNNIAGTVNNCRNNKNLKSSKTLGGIVGINESNATVEFCENYGEIIGNQSSYQVSQGGIVGNLSGGNIQECTNNGIISINSNFNYIGGIVGTASGDAFIKNCNNKGNITCTTNESPTIGGIAGDVLYTSSYETTKYIIGCYNDGNITIDSSSKEALTTSGGIAGKVRSTAEKTIIKDCYNIGNIDGVGTTAGGIVGETLTTNAHSIDIINCYNKGNINCFTNNGNWAVCVGGIVGDNRSYLSEDAVISIFNCYNRGQISGKAVLGKGAQCYLGGITGLNYVGEVSTGNICNTYNTGVIKVAKIENEHAGPIYGRNMGNVSNSYYLEGTIDNSTEIDEGVSNIINSTETFMVSNEFVTKLNNDTQDWKQDSENINDGYPILNVINLDKITITQAPSKTEYIEGQTFDREGMQVTAHYNDGTTAVVDNYTISPTRALQISDKSITVSYEENGITQTAEQEITVKAKSLDRIAIENEPTKKNYTEGDTLNTQGLTIRAYYNNGTNEVITNGFTCSPTTLNTVGTQKITVTYQNKTATFNVTVEARRLTEITITQAPSKTEYIERQTFDRAGMEVTAHYNDETTAVVDNYTISPTEPLTINDKTITVSYTENGITQTATQAITVNPKSVERITIENEPTKKNYVQGDILNTDGLKIRAYYNNDTNEVITNGFTCSPTTLNAVGTQKITVTYQNKTATFNVTVTAKQEPKPEKLLKGDVNGDGKVDFLDILAINKHRLGKTLLKGIYLEAADVNGDNVADFKDILQINKYRLGKINSI